VIEMAVTIGHASIDENNSAKGGSAGDQTKKEVCTRNWYSKPWTSVIRPKDSNVAEKIAKAMEQACANNNIGYDQNQRTTLFTAAKAVDWDLSKITTACECDCSSLVAVCVNAAGVPVSKDIYTGNEQAALMGTGKFEVLTGSSYTGSSMKLKRGDILLSSGHTAVVLSNGSKVATSPTPEKKPAATTTEAQGVKTDPARSFSRQFAKTYTVTASGGLNLRAGAATSKQVIRVLNPGEKVTCYGYYSHGTGSTVWLYVQDAAGRTGFCSMKYLR
jgi:hypothetical protein